MKRIDSARAFLAVVGRIGDRWFGLAGTRSR